MKLSDVKGERTFDVIAEIIEPIANIAQDKTAKDLFEKRACPNGVKPEDYMIARIKKSVPVLLRDHKKDLVTIIAAINDVTPEEYMEGLNLAVLVRDVVELLTDQELAAFLS